MSASGDEATPVSELYTLDEKAPDDAFEKAYLKLMEMTWPILARGKRAIMVPVPGREHCYTVQEAEDEPTD